MTVQAAQLDHFAVQFEAVISKLCLAEPEPARILVNNVFSSQQADARVIQIPMLKIPNGGSPADISQAGFFGYVSEGAVAIVFVQAVRSSLAAPSSFVPLNRKISIQPSLS